MPEPYDSTIAAIAGSQPLHTIDDVLRVMRDLDGALAKQDGLKWFNLLYLRVTESVKHGPPAGGWDDQEWMERFDVVFASYYFRALVAWAQGRRAVARCWRAMLDARWRRDVARIQFALAGMNAHINHDLALTLVRTSEERDALPDRGSPQHRDFERVNGLLERVEAEVKVFLLSPAAGAIERHLGTVDDVIAMWKVRKARDTAWSNGELLWHLRGIAIASRQFLQNLDGLVGLSSRGLLVPTQIV